MLDPPPAKGTAKGDFFYKEEKLVQSDTTIVEAEDELETNVFPTN
jgi:hypothetical protein